MFTCLIPLGDRMFPVAHADSINHNIIVVSDIST